MVSAPRTKLQLDWTHDRQWLACGTLDYEHLGRTPTDASHDMCHLLIAACSRLEWHPSGSRDLMCLAEYNAVLLETLLSRIAYATRDGHVFQPSLIAAVTKRMRWFVYRHFAPFPMEGEELWARFAGNIAAADVVRLCPYYFAMWAAERDHADRRSAHWQWQAHADDTPPSSGWIVAAQALVRQQFERMQNRSLAIAR